MSIWDAAYGGLLSSSASRACQKSKKYKRGVSSYKACNPRNNVSFAPLLSFNWVQSAAWFICCGGDDALDPGSERSFRSNLTLSCPALVCGLQPTPRKNAIAFR